MGKRKKNPDSVELTAEQKAAAIKMKAEHPDMTPKQISDALGIVNGAQISGLLFSLNTANGRASAAKNIEKVEAKEAKAAEETGSNPAPAPRGNPLVDRPGVGTPNAIASNLINAVKPAPVSMTQPNQGGGKVSVWRRLPLDLSGFFGEIPYPYSPHDLGTFGGEGRYAYKIVHKNGVVEEGMEDIPASYGPARNPRLYSSSEPTMMNPAVIPQKVSSPIEEATAGLVKAATEKVLNPPLPPKHEPTIAEKAGEKMIDAAISNLANPPKPAADNNRALSIDDYIRMEQMRQSAHDKRMEEIRVEAEGQAARIRAESEAAIAKAKAESEAAIAKAKAEAENAIARLKAEAEIKEKQNDAYWTRMRDIEKADMDRREKEMAKSVKDAEAAVNQAKDDMKKELADQRARDKDLNDARYATIKAQAESLVEVAKAQADAIRSKTSDDTWVKIAQEFKPVLQDAFKAASANKAMETNPGILNKMADNPAAAAAMAGAVNVGATQPEGNAMENQINAALSSAEFRAFLEDYCLSVEAYIEDAHYGPESFFRAFAAQMFLGPQQVAYLSVADFIGKRRWARMRPLLWPRLSEEQKTIVANPKHELFYETFRILVVDALKKDTREVMQSSYAEERMRTETERESKIGDESGNGEHPVTAATAEPEK